MKKLFYLLAMLVAAGVIFYGCQKDESPVNQELIKQESASVFLKNGGPSCEMHTSMIASGGDYDDLCEEGTGFKVGTVDVINEDDTVTVTYTLSDDIIAAGWKITATHVFVGDEDYLNEELCTKKGNPKVGNFPQGETFEDGTTEPLTYTFAGIEGDYVVAAHAVVGYFMCGDLEGFEAAMPEQVTLTELYPQAGGSNYFTSTISGGTILDGTYDS